jgi:tRNA A37 threonylcarbamoyladenosine dehydratase
VAPPEGVCEADGSLNCHGYGSSVTVTASFGMAAAGEAMALAMGLVQPART